MSSLLVRPVRVNGVILYRGPSKLDGKPIVVVATGLLAKSENVKTGAMVQTYILADDGQSPIEASKSGADKSICGACPHRPSKGGSCYVNLAQGPTSVYHGIGRGIYPVFDAKKHLHLFAGRTIRLGAYGDPAAVPIAVWDTVCGVAASWTGYTHQWRRCSKRYAKYCMASVETLGMRLEALAKGWRTFRVRTVNEPLGKGEFICPASDEAGKKRTCLECKACSGAKSSPNAASPVIIAHGLSWKVRNYERTLVELHAVESRRIALATI